MVFKRPVGIILIGTFYIIGAIALLLSLGTDQTIGINIRFGVPNIPETFVRVTVAIFSLILAYGYLYMKKWGYWLMMSYSILFAIISLNQLRVYNSQPFLGNAVFSLFVLVYTFKRRMIFHR